MFAAIIRETHDVQVCRREAKTKNSLSNNVCLCKHFLPLLLRATANATERCRQELFLRYVTLARGPQIGQRFSPRSVSSVHCTHKARACSLFSGRINRLFTRLSHLVLHAPHARPSAPSHRISVTQPLSHHPHSPSPQSLFEMERPSRHTHGFVQHDGSVVAVSLQPYHSSGRAAATAVGSLVGAFAAPMQSTGLIPIVPSYLMDGVCSYRPRRQAGSRRHEAVFFQKSSSVCAGTLVGLRLVGERAAHD